MFRVFSSLLREGGSEFAFLWALNCVSVAVHEQKVMRNFAKKVVEPQKFHSHISMSHHQQLDVASRKSLIFNPPTPALPCPLKLPQ